LYEGGGTDGGGVFDAVDTVGAPPLAGLKNPGPLAGGLYAGGPGWPLAGGGA